ncbi:MAG: pyrroline-5-carboxylate reductase [Hyphomicrobiales bacterium]|nr:MAG: pyrroline-5-carboxylate reductase [Hyphomicrobiales bacterium]
MSAAKICLVGAGNMGGAMLVGWLDAGYDPDSICVLDPAPSDEMVRLLSDKGVSHHFSAKNLASPELILLAVKPQIIADVLVGIRSLVNDNNVLVSVAAGTTIANLAAPFSGSPRIIRTMPNTPAQVGRGITVCVANDAVDDDQKTMASDLLRAIGQVEWVDDEVLIDAVTGVSGSGPAYVFYMAEAMAAAGEKAGLPAELAARLAKATVSGAGELMHQSSDTPAQLRKNVTSPNGTTAAALDVLMADDGLGQLMQKAVAAATKRSRELAK